MITTTKNPIDYITGRNIAAKYIMGLDILKSLKKQYEVLNIYNRWIILNVCDKLPNFGNDSSTYQDKKFIDELKEKNITFEGLHYLNKLKELSHEKAKKINIVVNKSSIIIGEHEIKIDKEINISDAAPNIMRYFAIGFSFSQHWALPREHYLRIVAQVENVSTNIESRILECFASPFNNQFQNYCSLYGEENTYGDFFELEYKKLPFDIYLINPPFIEHILYNAVARAIEMLDSKRDIKIIFVVPTWTDAKYYELIQNCKYIVNSDVSYHKYIQTLENKKIDSKFLTSHFILKN